MSKEKIIDIYIFGMKHELFQFIIPKKDTSKLVKKDFGIIEKRTKIIK